MPPQALFLSCTVTVVTDGCCTIPTASDFEARHPAADSHLERVVGMIVAADPQAAFCADKQGELPLLHALSCSSAGAVDVLLAANPAALTAVDDGRTVLYIACTFLLRQ